MKNLLKLSGLSILILTILMSCNKSEDDFIVSEPQSYNSNVEKIAKATSLALQEEDFRTFVYEESMKMFDGETNFLIKDVLKHSFDDGLTFEQKLSKEFSSIETFKNFINDNPKLQIAIPVHIGKWNMESYVPEVVFTKETFDDTKTEYVSGFDNNQNSIQMKVQEEPTVPVVVITLNERTDEFGNLRIKQTLEPTGDKVRDMDGAWEQISRMRFDNLSAVEPWVNGGPELWQEIRPAFMTTTTTSMLFGSYGSNFYDIRRRDINDKWYNLPNPNQFLWHRGQNRDGIDYGPAVLYTWWEEDNGGGSTQPVNITPTVITPNGTTITVPIQFFIGNNDDNMGDELINFSDPEPTIYSLGNIFRWESLQ